MPNKLGPLSFFTVEKAYIGKVTTVIQLLTAGYKFHWEEKEIATRHRNIQELRKLHSAQVYEEGRCALSFQQGQFQKLAMSYWVSLRPGTQPGPVSVEHIGRCDSTEELGASAGRVGYVFFPVLGFGDHPEQIGLVCDPYHVIIIHEKRVRS